MIGHHELGTIGEQEGQTFTRRQTLAFEGLGQAGRLVRKLPVGEAAAEKYQGRGLGSFGRGVEQQPGTEVVTGSTAEGYARVVMLRPG